MSRWLKLEVIEMKMSRTFAACLLALLATSEMACGNGDGESECPNLVGTWNYGASEGWALVFTETDFYKAYLPTCEAEYSSSYSCSGSTIKMGYQTLEFYFDGTTLMMESDDTASGWAPRYSMPATCVGSDMTVCDMEAQDCSFGH